MEKADCDIRFTVAGRHHVDQMYEIEKAVFSIPWSYESMVHDVCAHKKALYIVGTCNGEVVSYAGLWHVLDESRITNVAVREDFRGKGIGEKMMMQLFNAAMKLKVKTMFLEVRESNASAVALYEKIGFEKVGKRKGYYPDNDETAILMNKIL